MFSKFLKNKKRRLFFWISLITLILIIGGVVSYMIASAATILPGGDAKIIGNIVAYPKIDLTANNKTDAFTVPNGTEIDLEWTSTLLRTPCALKLNGASIGEGQIQTSGSQSVIATNTSGTNKVNRYEASCQASRTVTIPWINYPIQVGRAVASSIDVTVNSQTTTQPQIEMSGNIQGEPATPANFGLAVLPGTSVTLNWDLKNVNDFSRVACKISAEETKGLQKVITQNIPTKGSKTVTIAEPGNIMRYTTKCDRDSTKFPIHVSNSMVVSTSPDPSSKIRKKPIINLMMITPVTGAGQKVVQGGKAILSWKTLYGTSCSATDDLNSYAPGWLAMSGDQVIGPMKTLTLPKKPLKMTIKCSNKNGDTISRVQNIEVVPKVKVELFIKKSGTTNGAAEWISFQNDAKLPVVLNTLVDLKWQTQNAKTCNASGSFPGWSGAKTATGGEKAGITMNGNGVLTLICQDQHGFFASDSVFIKIVQK